MLRAGGGVSVIMVVFSYVLAFSGSSRRWRESCAKLAHAPCRRAARDARLPIGTPSPRRVNELPRHPTGPTGHRDRHGTRRRLHGRVGGNYRSPSACLNSGTMSFSSHVSTILADGCNCCTLIR